METLPEACQRTVRMHVVMVLLVEPFNKTCCHSNLAQQNNGERLEYLADEIVASQPHYTSDLTLLSQQFPSIGSNHLLHFACSTYRDIHVHTSLSHNGF